MTETFEDKETSLHQACLNQQQWIFSKPHTTDTQGFQISF